MPEILRIFFLVIILTASFAAYFLVVTTLFPVRVIKTQSVIQATPGRSFGLGLVNFVFFFVIAAILLSISDRAQSGIVKGIVTIPALIILAFLSVMLTFGLAGMVNYLGERILPEAQTWKQTIWGTVCLCFASALPFAGWFLLLPYAGFTGIGAFILSLFQREPKA